MKSFAFLIFFSVIFSIHAIVNYYIYVRGIQGLEMFPSAKPYFKWAMLFFVMAYPAGRFLEKVWISPVSDVFHWAGAIWFAVMLYAFLLIFALDLVRLVNLLFHFLPSVGTQVYIQAKYYVTIGVALLVGSVVLIGFLNAWHPKVVYKSIDIAKPSGSMAKVRIVAASDIHMGTIIAKRKVGKLVDTIVGLKPDLILFAGDVVDEDVLPVIRQNLGNSLSRLKAPLGVYASMGNHEYIGGADRAVDYLSAHGLAILRDSVVLINDGFYVVGREDRDKSRFSGQNRQSIDELLATVDRNYPIVMLDHQPYDLGAVSAAGIDLQISGHTHHGQLWPFGYVTERIFELSRGYLKKGNTHFYVSTGFGTWGPPVRTGNRPEIVVFDITFKRPTGN